MEDTYMKRRVVRIMTIAVGYYVQPRNNDRIKESGTSW
jgi:hypothetical protein